MNTTALDFALQLLQALPQLVQAGVDVTSAITRGREQLEAMRAENRAPSAAEWDELNERIRGLRSQLHAGDTTGTDG